MVLQQQQKNIATTNKFKVNRKQIKNWLAGKENIKKQKSKSKNVWGRKSQYPLLEEELLRKFREQRNVGKSIKKWWFLSKAKNVMLEKHPFATIFKY